MSIKIRQVRGLKIGDPVYCDKYNRLKDIRFKVTSFPNRGTVCAKIDEKIPGKENLTFTLSIKSVESEFLKS